jgi:multidrug resistance efflux pump
MRRFIRLSSGCLLALALFTGQSLLVAPARAAESKDAQPSQETEKPKAPEEAKGTEKAKEPEKPQDAEKPQEPEKPKEAEKPKEPQKADAAQEAKKPAAPKPATHTVQKGPLKIEVSLEGVFEAQQMSEISLEPEAWTTLSVVSAVDHGTRVKQGDLLLSLEREKIDRAISDLRAEHETSDLALKLAEQQLQTLEKTTPMNLAEGERTQKEVHEDLDYYFKVGRPMALQAAEFSLKWSQENFAYQEEELRQLEKMYQADDLTEETEEIILRRARNDLARAKFYLEQSKISHDRNVKVLIPRDDVSVKEAAQRIDLLWNETKNALPLTLRQQRLALEKLKLQRTRSEENLKKLLADRAGMTVHAPVAGVVYYGKCVQGRFSGSPSGTTSLRAGASLMPKQVVMTIVKTRPMVILTSVAEGQLHQVRAGIKGTAAPTGYPDLKLTAIVERVAGIPTGSGSFDSRITVALDDKAEPVMPGMTCKVTLTSYENRQALTVPPKCLKTDEEDEEKHYVYLLDKAGKPQKQYVTVGKRTAAKAEILKGLSEKDEVLLEPPQDDKVAEGEKKETPKEEAVPSQKKEDDDPTM